MSKENDVIKALTGQLREADKKNCEYVVKHKRMLDTYSQIIAEIIEVNGLKERCLIYVFCGKNFSHLICFDNTLKKMVFSLTFSRYFFAYSPCLGGMKEYPYNKLDEKFEDAIKKLKILGDENE